MAKATKLLFKHAPIPAYEEGKRDNYIANKLKASRRFRYLARVFGRGTVAFLKPAKICESRIIGFRLNDTYFQC